MAKRFTAESRKRADERRRKWRLAKKWSMMASSLGLDGELRDRIEESARRNRRRPHEDAVVALRWYYLEMWREQ